MSYAQQFSQWLTSRLAELPTLYLNSKTKATDYPEEMLRKSLILISLQSPEDLHQDSQFVIGNSFLLSH